MKTSMAAAALLSLLSTTTLAHHDGDIAAIEGVRISHAWTAEPSSSAHAIEVYLTIENSRTQPVQLVAATADIARRPGVFQASVLNAQGALSVTEVPAIVVAPGQTVTFQPGGIRLVLNDVKTVLPAGGHFDLDLTFEGFGTVEVEVEIEDRSRAGVGRGS